MKFYFYIEKQLIEAEDINAAHAKFSAYLWFPGFIMAQPLDNFCNPRGSPINLRTQTPEGIAMEKTRAKNKQGATYGHQCLLELVKLCEAYGIKKFVFEEEGDCNIELNERGKTLQKASVEGMDIKDES